jgi:hypothetical protein
MLRDFISYGYRHTSEFSEQDVQITVLAKRHCVVFNPGREEPTLVRQTYMKLNFPRPNNGYQFSIWETTPLVISAYTLV